MSPSLGGQLHYRSSFDLVPPPGSHAKWADIVKAIRSWLTRKVGQDDKLGGRWFYTKGSWKGPGKTCVQTTSLIGRGTETAPEYWAFRCDEQCKEFSYRRWRTDIALTLVAEQRFRFTISTMHWIQPGFLGEEPQSPIPTAPGIVGSLLRSASWRTFAGSQPLSAFPVSLKEGDGADLVKRLEASDRTCPIVLVTLDFSSGSPKIVPSRLARVLAGSAVVYAAASTGVDGELEWLLPSYLRCWNGTVRVYQPGVRLDYDRDGDRHRFFTARYIEEHTPETITEIIVRGVARRGGSPGGGAVGSIEDVASRQRESRIAEIRFAATQAKDQSLEDHLNALKEENDLYAEDNDDLRKRLHSLETKWECMQEVNANLETSLSATTLEKEWFQQHAAQAEAEKKNLRAQLECVSQLKELPKSLSDILPCIERLHTGRIVFTDRARKSAEDSSFKDIAKAWKCLWAMATTLHGIYFGEERPTTRIDAEFKARSGFALALTEKKLTKANKNLMALRKDVWDGEEIDITPHVKCGKEPSILRVYYYAHPKKKVIVIGQCGDHLDTSGTRKRK